MKKRTRTTLFVAFFLIFVIAAPVLILYVQGYRFDFENNKITRTGGLFIKTTPKQAEIYLDDEFIKKTDFLFGSSLIENLLPRYYDIKIKKDDYYTWEKNLEVREKQVTEMKNVSLFPKDPDFKLLGMNIENAWLSQNGKKIITQESENNVWSLKLYNPEKDTKTHLIKETDIYKSGAELISLEFTNSDKALLLALKRYGQLIYFELDIDKIPAAITITQAPQAPVKNALAYETMNNDIYYLDSAGYVYKTDESLTAEEKINEKPLSINKTAEYELHVFEKAVLLKESKDLYILNQEKEFEKIAQGVNNLKLSPDKKKVAYFSDSEINILFLEEQTFQPTFNKNETMFLLRLSETIQDAVWLNSHYLVFTTYNNLKIAEIDNRDRVNTVNVAKVENPRIFLSLETKNLCLLDRGNLFVSNNLVP